MIEPIWLDEALVLRLHEQVIDRFGGSHGVLNPSSLDSALHRPRQRFAYDETADLFVFAAAYAFGIMRNHPFIDGNKRTAMLALDVFLHLNRMRFEIADADGEEIAVQVASGAVSESEFADWIRSNSHPSEP